MYLFDSIESIFERIKQQNRKLEELFPDIGLESPAISKWSISKQLEHILLTNINILTALKTHLNSPPKKGKGLNLIGRLVLHIGFLPRGQGKAPELAVPKGVPKEELICMWTHLSQLFDQLEAELESLKTCRYSFRHLYFGVMNAKQWLRLIEVHTHHHLKIIRDIRHDQPR